MKLWKYFLGTLIRPQKTFSDLLQEKSALKYSLITMSIWCILYGFIALELYYKGEIPWTPWVKIPAEKYYLWESLFLPPLNILLWILFSALVFLFSYKKNATGTFQQIISVMGFAWSIPAFFMFLLPDFLIMIFFNKQICNLLWPIYGTLYFIWMIVLCSLGLKNIRKIGFVKALLICIVSFIIHFPIGYTFIR